MSKKVTVNGEVFEIEEDSHPVAEHFKQDIAWIELSKKLARYHEVCIELASLEAIKEDLRAELIKAGNGQESLMAGDYAAFFKKVSGRVSTDWKKAYRDAVGEMPSEDVSKYVTKADDTVRIEVKKLK